MLFSRSFLKITNVAHKHLMLQSQKLFNIRGNIVDLNYTTYENSDGDNSNSPVVVLHGLLASKDIWSWMSEAIHRATGRMVVNVDARNHGDSPHYPQHTYVDMTWDTVKLVQKLKMPKVTLLGHSMGGKTAMTMALLFPNLISSLIVVDISPITMPPQMIYNFPHVLDAICDINFRGILSIDEAVTFAREHMHLAGITQKDVVDFILRNVGIKPDETVGWIPNISVLREDYPTLLRFPYIPEMFPGPTMFVKAGQSNFLSPDDWAGIRRYFPQTLVECAHNAGHNIHEDDPSTLLKITTDFLMKYNI